MIFLAQGVRIFLSHCPSLGSDGVSGGLLPFPQSPEEKADVGRWVFIPFS